MKNSRSIRVFLGIIAISLAAITAALLGSSTARAIPCGPDPPTNVGLPVATLSPDGTTLTTTDGVWDTHGCPTTYSYNWYRSAFLVGDATDFEYVVVTADDQGLNLGSEITATNGNGSTTALSNTIPIPHGTNPFCNDTFNELSPPQLSGESEVTGTLTTSTATWDLCKWAIAGYRFQWLRNGVPISGETEQDYVVPAADQGQTISARVIAVSGLGDSLPADSNSVIIGPEPAPDPAPVYGNPQTWAGRPCFDTMTILSSCGGRSGETNFGGKFLDRPQGDLRGARATVRAPRRNSFYLPDFSAAVVRVTVESDPSNPYLVQTGFGREKHVVIGNCGAAPSADEIYTFYETIGPGAPLQQCDFNNGIHKRGRSKLYTVYRKRRSDGDNATWQTNVNGKGIHTRWMGFTAGVRAIVGGEITGLNRGVFPDGDVYGCYGCTAAPRLGVIQWQRATIGGSRGWTTITSANNITDPKFTDGRWQVSGLPGKFTVIHHCDGQHRYGC